VREREREAGEQRTEEESATRACPIDAIT